MLLLRHDDEVDDSRLATLDRWSGPDLDRLRQFRHRGAKTSWCFSRFLIRRALPVACGIDPGAVELRYGPHGKPYVAGTSVRFNWSHTSGCVALAVTVGREVGCDIEDATRRSWGYGEVADTYFTAGERSWVEAAPDEPSRWQRFLCIYVQKEARLKASGDGLSAPLDRVAVATQDPPFRDRSLYCFRFADRYLVAACTDESASPEPTAGLPAPGQLAVEIIAHRFAG